MDDSLRKTAEDALLLASDAEKNPEFANAAMDLAHRICVLAGIDTDSVWVPESLQGEWDAQMWRDHVSQITTP